MRVPLAFYMAVLVISCSPNGMGPEEELANADDGCETIFLGVDLELDCLNHVFGTIKVCSDGMCNYGIAYGLSPCNYIVQQTDKATHDFYELKPGETYYKCWQGEPMDQNIYPYTAGDMECLYPVAFVLQSTHCDCEYMALYGPDAQNYRVIPTNKATFDFYLKNSPDGLLCWEGQK